MHYEKTTHHTVTIKRFRDGDTVEGFVCCAHCGLGSSRVIRLLKIESWEPSGATKGKATQTAETLTREFRGVTGLLLRPSFRFDRYGRLLNDIIIDGTALSVLIVNKGLAWYGVGEPEPESLSFI